MMIRSWPLGRLFAISMLLGLGLGITACNGGGGLGFGSGSQQASTSSGGSGAAGASSSGGVGSSSGGDTPKAVGRVFMIEPGPNATHDMVNAMIQLRPKDVLEFGCGYFELSASLSIQATEDVTVRGCGMDKTVLSFKHAQAAEGLEALNVRGITVTDLTVLDSPGDAFKLKGVKWGTLRRVRALWSGGGEPITADNYTTRLHVDCTKPPLNEGDTGADYIPSPDTGRYGIYPVQSEYILVEDSESVGASDAGIYVGQSNYAIMRHNRAAYNVMGFEIENVQHGEYVDNTAECNTGGFLVYDLDGLTQYGTTSVVHGNKSVNNNTYNFAHHGTLIRDVPRGTGFITLAYDKLELYDNLFKDNSTAGIIYTSYELIDGKGKTGDKKLDPYTESFNVHDNTFQHNGYNPPPPNLQGVVAGEVATLLPTLVAIKGITRGAYQGADILWDGLRDDQDKSCPYPVDADGNPVPKDADGKPILTDNDPNPSCHYNAYKFDDKGQRIMPKWGSCMHDNTFSGDSNKYLNFHGTEGLEVVLALLDQDPSILQPDKLLDAVSKIPSLVGSTDLSEQDCMARYGKQLDPLPEVVIPPFVSSGDFDPFPSDEEIAALCEADTPAGQVNRGALGVNCPLLEQYHLFADATDPRSLPNGGGVPFVLNTKLFSDYATKYRVLFLPPGEAAVYRDHTQGVNATLGFPVGTVIAKTFAFTDESNGTEVPIETRLLILRQNSKGKEHWDGLPYIWEADADGKLVAKLEMGGGTRSVKWYYHNRDSGKLLQGSTDHYSIPNANQCITCHGNDDKLPGAAPIGPKVRNLNRPYVPESTFMNGKGQASFPAVNQLQDWVTRGLLKGAPPLDVDPNTQIATNVERLPKFNVPGDAGFPAGSKQDIEARTRAYLEVNCEHCHNDKGTASNTGFYLDSFRQVGLSYGICKTPTATGGGSCDRSYVIVPGSADASIVTCRVGAKDDPQKRMPPIARSVVHEAGLALITQWINTVVDSSYPNAQACQ